MTSELTMLLTALVVAAIAVVIWGAFYQRASRETSLVRTGVGGRKIVMDGGTIALPYFHEVQRVNMQTLRLEVRRSAESALITNDRMRVDVGAEFYVSVAATPEGVAKAAQTLGNRTFSPDKLRELIDGKLIDALRSVAARMTMDELHENRGTFVSEVAQGLAASLARNGLELDSVSLTALDQTPFSALDENNAFNAVGMRRLAEVIANSKKERAQIDAESEVSVRKAAMLAAKQTLQIELEEQEAELSQVQKIEALKAAQIAEVIKRKAEGELEGARARIQMEQSIRAAEFAREKGLLEADIARERDRAAADLVRAESVRATEAIATAKQVAEAERRKEIALLAARQDSEIVAMRLRMQAAAEKDAALDRARARLEDARADADATEIRAAARRKEQLAQAEGQRAIIDAENKIDRHIVAMKVDLARLEALPRIVAEMVKPAEKIESIRINHMSGFGGTQGAAGAKPPLNQAIDSILEMAVQLPALRMIGDELAMDLEGGVAKFAARALDGRKDAAEPAPEPKKS
ncbi:MAG: SPFH domain-containing protein [Betaproteobacteria bacterium]|nr:SPFH domain-containing protein [Betaproteobacteria bacterium]